MRTLQCTVPAAFDGRPLKHLLRGELGISSTLLKTLKWREGAILLNGAGVHVNAIVRTGDTVTVVLSERAPRETDVAPLAPFFGGLKKQFTYKGLDGCRMRNGFHFEYKGLHMTYHKTLPIPPSWRPARTA